MLELDRNVLCQGNSVSRVAPCGRPLSSDDRPTRKCLKLEGGSLWLIGPGKYHVMYLFPIAPGCVCVEGPGTSSCKTKHIRCPSRPPGRGDGFPSMPQHRQATQPCLGGTWCMDNGG